MFKEPLQPLFKWSGGKRSEIKNIKNFIPEFSGHYIEPFVGGGALFFALNKPNSVINDKHREVYTFYKQISKGKNKAIKNYLASWENTEDCYYKVRKTTFPTKTGQASKFIYLRKTCYRGMLRYNSKGEFNIPFGRYKSYNYEELEDTRYVNLLSQTEIFNKDFEEIFNMYNDENNFVFLDPPYDSAFSTYGPDGVFNENDHRRLAKCFKETKNKCLMVIGKTKLIEELYSDYIIGSYDKKYAFKLHSGRITDDIDNEHLVIANYSVQN